jgi:hypothetical protein
MSDETPRLAFECFDGDLISVQRRESKYCKGGLLPLRSSGHNYRMRIVRVPLYRVQTILTGLFTRSHFSFHGHESIHPGLDWVPESHPVLADVHTMAN